MLSIVHALLKVLSVKLIAWSQVFFFLFAPLRIPNEFVASATTEKVTYNVDDNTRRPHYSPTKKKKKLVVLEKHLSRLYTGQSQKCYRFTFVVEETKIVYYRGRACTFYLDDKDNGFIQRGENAKISVGCRIRVSFDKDALDILAFIDSLRLNNLRCMLGTLLPFRFHWI